MEGNKSIECYDLKRDDLIFFRKRLRDKYLRDIKKALILFEKSYTTGIQHAKEILFASVNEKLSEFTRVYEDKEDYSLFHFYMLTRFEDFFIAELQIQDHKELILEAYNIYKATNSLPTMN